MKGLKRAPCKTFSGFLGYTVPYRTYRYIFERVFELPSISSNNDHIGSLLCQQSSNGFSHTLRAPGNDHCLKPFNQPLPQEKNAGSAVTLPFTGN